MKKCLIVIGMTIFICGFTLVAWAGEPINLVKNDQNIRPDVSPQILDNRLMVPVRWVAETLGADVKWNPLSRTILITINADNHTDHHNNDNDEATVTRLVKNFGQKMKNVSLLAPEDIVKKSIHENYGDLVAPELLSKWQGNPTMAPGRLLSSPWPEYINIIDIGKLANSKYQIKGEIIEMTSTEKVNGDYTTKHPLVLVVEQINNDWLITEFKLDDYQIDKSPIVYLNTQYGFSFELPESWQGYKVISEKWEGLTINASDNNPTHTGPLILIRHPNWTNEEPRQDIPIMIFKNTEWDSLQKREFHIGAAPIGPKELGRNDQYVFALPARYNFAFPSGYEEVEEILENKPLKF